MNERRYVRVDGKWGAYAVDTENEKEIDFDAVVARLNLLTQERDIAILTLAEQDDCMTQVTRKPIINHASGCPEVMFADNDYCDCPAYEHDDGEPCRCTKEESDE